MTGEIIKDLGDGLVLRRATAADVDALVEFNARIHGNFETNEPDERVGEWVRDLVLKPHPTFNAGDFTIVEETKSGKIVSSLNLIDQTWSYAGIEFGMGRPELVGTEPEYRKRGLVRAQFEVIHQWSAARGHMMQAITGIPYYYRQFGYEMGLALGGGRIGYLPHVPALKEGEPEPFTLRPAVESDIPFLMDVYRHGARRSLVSAVWDEALWRYELNGKSEKNVNRSEVRVIESAQGEAVGFLMHPPDIWGAAQYVTRYELKAGVSWLAVTSALIRYLAATGKAHAAQKVAQNKEAEFQAYNFNLGREHPVYQAASERMPRLYDAYAWYVRVPDLAGFLGRIAPVLEQRLAESPLAGHTGELKLGFYRSGVKLSFEQGLVKGVESYIPDGGEDGDVIFPDLTFLRVLFGYNSFEEVNRFFADCFSHNDQGRALAPILFPKHDSSVLPIS
jgi:hypothetical protein